MRNRLVPKWMTLTFVQRSYQGHVNRCVTFDVEYLGNRQRQRLGSKGPPIGNSIWAFKQSPQRCCEAVWWAILATAWLLVKKYDTVRHKVANVLYIYVELCAKSTMWSFSFSVMILLSRLKYDTSLQLKYTDAPEALIAYKTSDDHT